MSAASIDGYIAAAESRWGHLGLPRARFLAELAARRAEGVELQAADLYLACACAEGIEAAIVAFEREYAAEIAAGLRRADVRGLSADDLRQELREKLFVGDHAKIRDYSGRGKLKAWVRVTMLHLRIDAERRIKVRAEQSTDDGEALADTLADDPELAHLKSHYREAFGAALAESLRALPERDRALLRDHLAHDLQTARLAESYGVHRATLKRWLAGAREQLLAATRRAMRARVGVDTAEFDSVMQLLESRLDASVKRLLGDPSAGA
jgi:RNA polymerase sigma-70 factor, ECF subfamily